MYPNFFALGACILVGTALAATCAQCKPEPIHQARSFSTETTMDGSVDGSYGGSKVAWGTATQPDPTPTKIPPRGLGVGAEVNLENCVFGAAM